MAKAIVAFSGGNLMMKQVAVAASGKVWVRDETAKPRPRIGNHGQPQRWSPWKPARFTAEIASLREIEVGDATLYRAKLDSACPTMRALFHANGELKINLPE